MTARTVRGDNTLEIESVTGETPEEVLTSYTQELTQLGHEIIHGRGWTMICKTCRKDFRYYVAKDHHPVIAIYSDFKDGEQCSKRHMSAFIGWLWPGH